MILAVLQSSTILLIAFAVVSLIGRRLSAATRHWILTVALFASAVVPLLGSMVPSINIRLGRFTHVVAGFSPRPLPPRQETRAEARDYISDSTIASSIHKSAGTQGFAAFVLWVCGTLVAVVFFISGMLRVSSVTGHAQLVANGQLKRMADQTAHDLRIKRPIQLLQNQRAILGTWGIVRPAVLLPEDVDTWSADRLRIVITHELAHIKRMDWPVQIVAELARAAYWFNPLFWFLCRRLRSESELACDDVVLNAGYDAGDYATHLLELARASKTRRRTWSPVLAMAQPPHLERRFIAMLNPSINRTPVNRVVVIVTCVLALLVTIPLAAVQAREEIKPPLIASPPAALGPLSVVKVAAATAATSAPRKTAAKPAPAQGLGSLSGAVSDWTGAVIPGVRLTIFSRTVNGNSVTETEVETRPSDETGAFNFPALTPGQYSLIAELPGFSTYRSVLQIELGQTLKEKVTLSVGGVTQRVVVTAVGQPKPASFPGTPQRIRVGGNVIAANLISQVKPFYPQSARDAGIEGIVHLQGLIGTDGTLIGLSPLNFINADLMNAAMDAVRQWRYKPTLLNNEPVQVLTTIDVEFKLAQ